MCAAAMCLGGVSAQAIDVDDYIFIEDLSIAPGETKPLTVWVNHDVWWTHMITNVILPKGLVIEKLDPNEIDPELFTLNYFYYEPQDTSTEYVALSTVFTDKSYGESEEHRQQLIKKAQQESPWCENLETIASVTFCYANNTAYTIIGNDLLNAHHGEYPVLQYRVRATEELEDDAVITTRVAFIGYRGASYIGQQLENNINGKEMTFRVRRVDPQPEMNYDVNGDGNVDIDDVNAVINAVLRK